MASLYPEQVLQRRALAWALELKVNPEKIVIARMSSKWGSCAPDGVVTLAEDLVRESDTFQDYVIVHELLHLRYRNHGKVFKALMTAHVPKWREIDGQRSHDTERPRGGR
ncbi:M48 family metallopeptidase [Curtobacterium sp. MCBD17_008]|uniref:M48 metallopeptidase family protein n=1 Tax=Curtobacterium sp. MCBD17_008 TaxID=2175656 RepID=UPI000DA73FB3|nr:M48 family metallopeptidase [Curtobacterium sp. MCBD17_008]PZE95221.1 hypothetical protein DEI95_02300 [Curtobacterium sp. MCBD17_008]